MNFADIRLVIGTRSEAIKLKPVATALAARGLAPSLIFTGQHPDLDPGELGFGNFACTSLGCPDREYPYAHVREVTIALRPILRALPDLIIVQGGTSSALGGALAAFTAAIPVAHVEAGLRTHDPLASWPEEEYRSAIEADADLLFAPTDLAAATLRAAHVPGEIHVAAGFCIAKIIEQWLKERSLTRRLA